MDDFERLRFDFPDTDVRKRVSNFLQNKNFPAFRNIKVVVHHGTVTLTGNVCSYYEKQVALNTCRRVAGVLAIIDKLDVAEQPPLVDYSEIDFDEVEVS